jgi:hypothetical protein
VVAAGVTPVGAVEATTPGAAEGAPEGMAAAARVLATSAQPVAETTARAKTRVRIASFKFFYLQKVVCGHGPRENPERYAGFLPTFAPCPTGNTIRTWSQSPCGPPRFLDDPRPQAC